MSNEQPDNQAMVEQLTAYLDGELDAESSRQIEQRLSNEPALRQELHRLDQAWQALGELPRHEVSSSFASSTLTMVAVREAEVIQAEMSPAAKSRWRTWLAGLAGVAAALLAGYFGAAALLPHRNRLLLEDLPVIENLDAYRHAENVDFLRKLKASGMFPATEEKHVP